MIQMVAINCDPKPIEALRYAVIRKYGKIYGTLKIEVGKAVSERAEKLIKECDKEGK